MANSPHALSPKSTLSSPRLSLSQQSSRNDGGKSKSPEVMSPTGLGPNAPPSSNKSHSPSLNASSSGPSSQMSSRTASRHTSIAGDLDEPFTVGAAGQRPDYSDDKIVVAMVGLPARGKSYLSNKLSRYLKVTVARIQCPGAETPLGNQIMPGVEISQVFNAGQLRRSKARHEAELLGVKRDHSANFFDQDNNEAYQKREALAEECLESLIDWLKNGGGNVGIHDATNSTRDRREKLRARVACEPGMTLLFLESICTDQAIIDANIALKVSSGDPDYSGQSKEEAEVDFRERIKKYERTYQTVDPQSESHLTYAKITNVGANVEANRIEGYLQSRIVFYLMNLHLTPRSIFFSRHGESQYNVEGKIGGDAGLSSRGAEYAKILPKLVRERIGDRPLTVWTSTLKRTIATGKDLPYAKLTWKALDELDAGVCDGMTYEEIEEHYPEDYAARDDDKFNYRYRGGESYRDVVVRLEPVIMELERQENIMLICHQAVLRCLYAYFHDLSADELPYIKVPLHTLIELKPKAYGCDELRYTAPIDAVDTTRPRVHRTAAANTTSGRTTPSEVPTAKPININAPRDWNATF